MKKKIWYILSWSVFGFIFLGIIIISITPTKAETSATTFPVEEAGIAAYVKLDSVDITDLTEALNYFSENIRQGKTYVIGKVKITNQSPRGVQWFNYPHLYIGLDGWMIAYYLKGEETSQIMQWKGYTAGKIETTTLKEAIDIMAANIGVKYSTPIKYYHFQYPQANKLTLIVETIIDGSNCFSVTIPGILYEASYSAYMEDAQTPTLCYNWPLIISVNETEIFRSPATCRFGQYYGFYNLEHLIVNKPHLICVEKKETGGQGAGAATVLIYKVP